MNSLKSIVVIALLCALLPPLTLSAQEDAPPASPKTPVEGEKPAEDKPAEEKPKPAELDEISKKLVEGYRKMSYHLGRAGVKKASYNITAKVSDAMSGQEMEGKGTYKWDGETGSLEWDNAQLGLFLGQRGIAKEQMDGNFVEESLVDKLAGTKLTGKMNEDGTAKITIEGENPEGFRAFTYDKDGILTVVELKRDVGTGQPTDIKSTMSHTKVGEKLAVSGLDVNFEIPGFGEITIQTTFTYVKNGEFTVMSKTEMSQSLAGAPMSEIAVTLSDWKLNDDVE